MENNYVYDAVNNLATSIKESKECTKISFIFFSAAKM